METNVREGSEDARQIAPGVAGSDAETRRVWIGLAIVVALALLLPGCGEGEGDAAALALVGVIAGVAGVAQAVRATLRARRAENLVESRTTLMDVALRDLSKANAKLKHHAETSASFDAAIQRAADARVADAEKELAEAQRQIAALKSDGETAKMITFALCGSYERLFPLVGLSTDDLKDNDPEGMEAMLTQRIEKLIAAADACAELLSGPNAPGEHTAARVALRATGRLGGAIGPCGPGCGNPTSKHDSPCVMQEPKS